MKAHTITFLLCFLFTVAFAQKQIPESVQKQITNFETNAIKSKNAGNETAAASYYNRIAYLYWEYFIYDGAIKNFEEVLILNKSTGNRRGEQKILDNIAFIYSDMERYDKSIEYFKESYAIISTNGSKSDLAVYYSNIASAFNNNGQSQNAIKNAEPGLQLSKELNNMKLVRKFYGILYEAYDKLGDKEKSIEYFNLYSSIDKHLLMKQVGETVTKLENEKNYAISMKELKEAELKKTQDSLEMVEFVKKEQEMKIALLDKESKISELTIKTQNSELAAKKKTITFLVLFFVAVLLFAAYAYQQMKARKKANKKLQALNKEIQRKNNQIVASIDYASHIQQAILPIEQKLKEDIPNLFIYYKPRDIVSGDFYWSSKIGNKVFIAAIDCTGHGVPGAFMSMIGNTILNQVVNENGISDPALVLGELNERIAQTLKQSIDDHQGFSEDGMDITFLSYDTKKQIVEIALANHTASIFVNGRQKLLEGDIFSVGGNVGLKGVEFTKHKLIIEKKTTIYMYSDGYQDQFGGDKNQKYLSSRFYKLLESISSKPMNEQYKLIDDNLKAWKGDTKQIDDILVIGLRLGS